MGVTSYPMHNIVCFLNKISINFDILFECKFFSIYDYILIIKSNTYTESVVSGSFQNDKINFVLPFSSDTDNTIKLNIPLPILYLIVGQLYCKYYMISNTKSEESLKWNDMKVVPLVVDISYRDIGGSVCHQYIEITVNTFYVQFGKIMECEFQLNATNLSNKSIKKFLQRKSVLDI